MNRLILASSSPRRKALLQEHGYQFEVVAPDDSAECGICSRESPAEMVARLAYQKAANVIGKIDDGLVIACDTVAECGGMILGKPIDRDHAHQMLRRLSGTRHRVFSGLCLWDKLTSKRMIDVGISVLKMDVLSDQDLEHYLDSEQWMGKAGAFGFQDDLDWVHLESGSSSNVVGLPMEMLSKMLQSFQP
jgi:septum formation protein